MKIDAIFQIVAVMLAGIAAFFWWQGNTDGLFVSAVLGAVAFFLSIRFQVKERNRIRHVEAEEAEESTPAETDEEIKVMSAEKDPTRTA